MTLIVAAKEGLYADFRQLCVVGSSQLPNRASKIHVANDPPMYALGMAGSLCVDHVVTGKIGFLSSVWSFYRWYCRDWKPYSRSSPMINLSATLGELFTRVMNRYMAESRCGTILVITPHHTVTIDKESPILESSDSLSTAGSSQDAAALLYNAGYTVPKIYPMLAKCDTLITADFDFEPREALECRFPFFLFDSIVRQEGTEFDFKITEEEYRYILLMEMVNAQLFAMKASKRSPTEAQLKKAWLYGTRAHDWVVSDSLEKVKKDLHELYSLQR